LEEINLKKNLFVLLVLMTGIAMVGCSESGDPNDREVKTSEETNVEESATEETATEEAAEEPKEEKLKENPVGTRSNPLPFGDIITVETVIYDSEYSSHDTTLDLSLLEVIRGEEAWALLQPENMFNEKAPEGSEDVLIKVKATVTSSETDNDPLRISSYDFKFVSAEGKVYDNMTMTVAPEELEGELYNGASVEGYVHGIVNAGDDFKLSYEPMSGSPVFFEVK
jgi:hypothetical protein